MANNWLHAWTLPLFLAAPLWLCAVDAPAHPKPDAVVALDGSGQYASVQAAIDAAPQISHSAPSWIIFIKSGTYKELVYVQREKRFISLVGEDAARTIITYDLHASVPGPDGKSIGTFRTPTVFIDADDFSAENLTFENSSGPQGQALAVRIDGDRVTFRGCRFLGWQDTVLGNRGRHYFKDCDITGAVDFIFGGATEFYENCGIHCAGNGYITAASTPDGQAYGFVFDHCRIDALNPESKIYLGRPWRDYAAVVFLHTSMSEVVQPAGWHNWSKPEREKTARYAEFKSTGPGANPAARVPWSRQLSDAEAKTITRESVLAGNDGWNPCVP